jgi:hypothetical protein
MINHSHLLVCRYSPGPGPKAQRDKRSMSKVDK